MMATTGGSGTQRQGWRCPYCQKNNFKTERGYHHHLNTAKICQSKHFESRSQNDEQGRMKEARNSIRQQERTFPATSTSTLPLDRRVTRSNTRQRFATLFAHDEGAESSILISRPTLVLNGPDDGNDDDITEEFTNPFNQDFDEMDVDSSSEESEDDPDKDDNKPEESGSSDDDCRPNDYHESLSSDDEESGSLKDEESGSLDDDLRPNDDKENG